MTKIATHNSATGEASASWVDALLVPFARCQSKTIKEQYNAGCRYFDIRYKWSDKRGRFVCGHGLWTSSRSLRDVIEEINTFGDCYVMLTCESGAPLQYGNIRKIIAENTGIQFTTFNRKHPYWRTDFCELAVKHTNNYQVLDWSTWHTFIPLPWLWSKLFKKKEVKGFSFVDFL